MKNKRGWLRIVEAVFGILLVASVLLVIYSSHRANDSDYDYVYEMQKKVLTEIADDYRQEVMDGENLTGVAQQSFPNNFKVVVKICDIDERPCKPTLPLESEVFVEDRIVSATLESYSPKKVRVFVWEKDK